MARLGDRTGCHAGRRSRIVCSAIVIAVFGAWVSESAAAGYVTHTNQVALTTRGVPPYDAANPLSAAYTDEAFGQKVVRVTGNEGDAILIDGTTNSGEVWPRHACQSYSSTETAWNCDGSLLLLDGCSNRDGILLDGNTFKVIRYGVGFFAQRFWSRTDPEIMYAVGRNIVQKCSPRTGECSNVVSLDGYSDFQLHGQGRRFADDGQTIAIEAKKGTTLVGFLVNVVTGKKTVDIQIPATDSDGEPYNGSVGITAGGKYMDASYGYGGTDYDLYDAATGKRVFHYTGGGLTLKHRDTYSFNGRDYQIAGVSGSSPLRYVRRDMLTGEMTDIVGRLGIPNHTSTRMYKDGRWAIVSFDDARSTSMLRLEIAAIRIDGGEGDTVRRLAQHMSYRYVYSNEPHPNPSPDGKKIVFASNWGAVTGSSTPTSAYVILLPDWDTPAQVTAPSALSYADNPATYKAGQQIETNEATVTGTVDSFSISPALPAGLALDSKTGDISGTPTAVAAEAKYTVTATNAAGSCNAELTITVGNDATVLFRTMRLPSMLNRTGEIEVIRLDGRIVRRIQGGWDAGSSGVVHLPAGVYGMRMRTVNGPVVTRLLVAGKSK